MPPSCVRVDSVEEWKSNVAVLDSLISLATSLHFCFFPPFPIILGRIFFFFSLQTLNYHSNVCAWAGVGGVRGFFLLQKGKSLSLIHVDRLELGLQLGRYDWGRFVRFPRYQTLEPTGQLTFQSLEAGLLVMYERVLTTGVVDVRLRW